MRPAPRARAGTSGRYPRNPPGEIGHSRYALDHSDKNHL